MTGGAQQQGRVVAQAATLALVGLIACGNALAQVDTQAALDVPPLPPRAEQSARLEVANTTVPRFDAVDGAAAQQRLDLTLLPPRPNALGLAVGMSNLSPASSAAIGAPAFAPQPAVDLGVHYRHTLENNHRIDVTAWRRMTQEPEAYTLAHQRQPTFGARVELNLTPENAARSSNAFQERGFVGFQLDNGARIVVRRKHGGPMVYYRVRF